MTEPLTSDPADPNIITDHQPPATLACGLIPAPGCRAKSDTPHFGVVTLLGLGQAELIERMLIDKLGEREIEQRKIKCGNAYHFQGDERDVMFLSLVISSGEGRRIGAKTKDSDRQEMNVAASRARDQMFCVRSISADELNIDDVRGRFIRYCQDPSRVEDVGGDMFAKCDSDFERDVLRELLQRGFKVLVQHRVGRFRIDIVVVGRRGRLAIELDGDAFHGPDRWGADRNRQVILERLGWRFHRIRGSKYYRGKDEALAALWDHLEREDIWPHGQGPEPVPAPATFLAPSAPVEAEPDQPDHDLDFASDRGSGLSVSRPSAPMDPSNGQSEYEWAQLRQRLFRPTPVGVVEPELERAVLPLPTERVAQSFSSGPSRTEPPLAAPTRAPTSLAPPLGRPGGTPVRSGDRPQQFVSWTERRLPPVDIATQNQIERGLVEIVTGEGPMVAQRAYELYVKASGGARVGKNIRSTLNRVLAHAVRSGTIAQIEDPEPGQSRKTIYLPGTAEVVVRTRGDRNLEDIPFTEVVALIGHLRRTQHLSSLALKRTVLEIYKRSRLTSPASTFLDRCIEASGE